MSSFRGIFGEMAQKSVRLTSGPPIEEESEQSEGCNCFERWDICKKICCCVHDINICPTTCGAFMFHKYEVFKLVYEIFIFSVLVWAFGAGILLVKWVCIDVHGGPNAVFHDCPDDIYTKIKMSASLAFLWGFLVTAFPYFLIWAIYGRRRPFHENNFGLFISSRSSSENATTADGDETASLRCMVSSGTNNYNEEEDVRNWQRINRVFWTRWWPRINCFFAVIIAPGYFITLVWICDIWKVGDLPIMTIVNGLLILSNSWWATRIVFADRPQGDQTQAEDFCLRMGYFIAERIFTEKIRFLIWLCSPTLVVYGMSWVFEVHIFPWFEELPEGDESRKIFTIIAMPVTDFIILNIAGFCSYWILWSSEHVWILMLTPALFMGTISRALISSFKEIHDTVLLCFLFSLGEIATRTLVKFRYVTLYSCVYRNKNYQVSDIRKKHWAQIILISMVAETISIGFSHILLIMVQVFQGGMLFPDAFLLFLPSLMVQLFFESCTNFISALIEQYQNIPLCEQWVIIRRDLCSYYVFMVATLAPRASDTWYVVLGRT